MARKIVLLVLALAAFAPSAWAQMTFKPKGRWEAEKARVREPNDMKTDRGEYRYALAVYQAGNTRTAMRLCDGIVKTYKSGPWVERACLLKARAWFKQGDVKKADKELRLLRKRFPGATITREISDLQLAIGVFYLKKGKYTGVKILQDMVERNPYGPRADEAQFRIARYYLGKGHYVDAAEAFALVVAQYRNSRYREEAMFLKAKASYLDNEGPRRDPLPYEEARVGLSDYLKAYPTGKRTGEAKRLLGEIDDALARKQYLIAEYYRKQRRYRAAHRYYVSLVRKYPNSKWAQKGRKRLPRVEKRVKPRPKAEPGPAGEKTAGTRPPEEKRETK